MAVIYNMSHVDAMDGHEFEHFIANLLRKLNYQKVEVTPGSGDQGVDVLAEKDGVRYAIQCKCYSSDLGNTPVQEVNTGKVIYHCHVGVVLTNQHFTKSAWDAANATGVLLWDRPKLESMMAQAQMENTEDPVAQQSSESFTPWTGSPLLRRGAIALKDREWKKAAQFFDRVLNADPENAAAYLGLVMADGELPDLEAFAQMYISHPKQLYGNYLSHMKDFADPKLSAWFEELEKQKKLLEDEQAQMSAIRLAPIRESLKKSAFLLVCSSYLTAGLKTDGTVVAVGESPYRKCKCDVSDWTNIVALAVDDEHIVGLKVDGTVVATGNNENGQCDVSNWTNIIAVTARNSRTVGLKEDGTVVIVGDDHQYSQFDVSDWTNIMAVAVGDTHMVGLKKDGTVVATGDNETAECDVSDWTGIVSVAVGFCHTVGLAANGTVVATGDNENGQCNVSDWTNIVAVAVEGNHTVGLKADGTVVAVGCNEDGRCDVSDWTSIVAVTTGYRHTVGLKANGTVVATGDNRGGECNVSDWTNIVAVAIKLHHMVGLKTNGTVLAVGFNYKGQCDVHNWKLFDSFCMLEDERSEIKARREAEHRREKIEQAKAERQRLEKITRKKAELEMEQAKLQIEIANLKGLFTGKRRREIEARLTEIEAILKNIHI